MHLISLPSFFHVQFSGQYNIVQTFNFKILYIMITYKKLVSLFAHAY